ncbi:MAG: DASS family sodium-coupled anion symporter [Phaeodactylibacter sp.]|nr:DASS family sodium-coupled anion symporter [Phaeodactylibacter sp.]
MIQNLWKNLWARRAATLLAGLLIWFAPVPWGLQPEAWQLFAIFITAILAVLLDALSIFTAAVLAMVIAVLAGVLATEKAFSGFSEDFMLLILSAFLVSKGVVKSGLGNRIAFLLIRRFGHSTLRLGYCIVATDALLGPAIPSNTARSGVLYPIVLPLCLDTGSQPDDESRRRSGSYLMMVSIASLTVSSALWLTAMAANPIAAGMGEQYGVQMDFVRWLLVSSLPSLLAMVALPYVLYRLSPPEARATPEAPLAAGKALEAMGPLSDKELIMGAIFVTMVVLWGLAGMLGISMAIVAFLGLAAMLLFNILSIKDLRREGGDALETFIWFAILYVMSSALNELGFMSTLGQQIAGQMKGMSWLQAYGLLLLLYVLIHYLFVSQTAQLLALFGVFLEVGVNAGVPAALMAYMLAFATNYFAALTPQASSSNVLFAGSGYLTQQEMYRNGAIITLANFVIYMVCTPWVLWVSG